MAREWKGREGCGNGEPGCQHSWRGGRRARWRAGTGGRGRGGLAAPTAGLAASVLFGSAAPRIRARSTAPRSVARQALPRQRSAILVAATLALCRATMHGAAQAFGHARAIGAAKSVSFKIKKTDGVRFKIKFKKWLKLKKTPLCQLSPDFTRL